MVFGKRKNELSKDQLLERAAEETLFWKNELDRAVHDKNVWMERNSRMQHENEVLRAQLFLTQQEAAALKLHLQQQQQQQQQQKSTHVSDGGASDIARRDGAAMDSGHAGAHYSSSHAFASDASSPPGPPQPPAAFGGIPTAALVAPMRASRETTSPLSPRLQQELAWRDTLKAHEGSLQQQLVNAENLLKHQDVQTALLQERVDVLHEEVHRLREENAALLKAAAVHEQHAAQLRGQLTAQRGMHEETADVASKVWGDLSGAQQANARLKAEAQLKDQMIELLQEHVALLESPKDRRDEWPNFSDRHASIAAALQRISEANSGANGGWHSPSASALCSVGGSHYGGNSGLASPASRRRTTQHAEADEQPEETDGGFAAGDDPEPRLAGGPSMSGLSHLRALRAFPAAGAGNFVAASAAAARLLGSAPGADTSVGPAPTPVAALVAEDSGPGSVDGAWLPRTAAEAYSTPRGATGGAVRGCTPGGVPAVAAMAGQAAVLDSPTDEAEAPRPSCPSFNNMVPDAALALRRSSCGRAAAASMDAEQGEAAGGSDMASALAAAAAAAHGAAVTSASPAFAGGATAEVPCAHPIDLAHPEAHTSGSAEVRAHAIEIIDPQAYAIEVERSDSMMSFAPEGSAASLFSTRSPLFTSGGSTGLFARRNSAFDAAYLQLSHPTSSMDDAAAHMAAPPSMQTLAAIAKATAPASQPGPSLPAASRAPGFPTVAEEHTHAATRRVRPAATAAPDVPPPAQTSLTSLTEARAGAPAQAPSRLPTAPLAKEGPPSTAADHPPAKEHRASKEGDSSASKLPSMPPPAKERRVSKTRDPAAAPVPATAPAPAPAQQRRSSREVELPAAARAAPASAVGKTDPRGKEPELPAAVLSLRERHNAKDADMPAAPTPNTERHGPTETADVPSSKLPAAAPTSRTRTETAATAPSKLPVMSTATKEADGLPLSKGSVPAPAKAFAPAATASRLPAAPGTAPQPAKMAPIPAPPSTSSFANDSATPTDITLAGPVGKLSAARTRSFEATHLMPAAPSAPTRASAVSSDAETVAGGANGAKALPASSTQPQGSAPGVGPEAPSTAAKASPPTLLAEAAAVGLMTAMAAQASPLVVLAERAELLASQSPTASVSGESESLGSAADVPPAEDTQSTAGGLTGAATALAETAQSAEVPKPAQTIRQARPDQARASAEPLKVADVTAAPEPGAATTAVAGAAESADAATPLNSAGPARARAARPVTQETAQAEEMPVAVGRRAPSQVAAAEGTTPGPYGAATAAAADDCPPQPAAAETRPDVLDVEAASAAAPATNMLAEAAAVSLIATMAAQAPPLVVIAERAEQVSAEQPPAKSSAAISGTLDSSGSTPSPETALAAMLLLQQSAVRAALSADALAQPTHPSDANDRGWAATAVAQRSAQMPPLPPDSSGGFVRRMSDAALSRLDSGGPRRPSDSGITRLDSAASAASGASATSDSSTGLGGARGRSGDSVAALAQRFSGSFNASSSVSAGGAGRPPTPLTASAAARTGSEDGEEQVASSKPASRTTAPGKLAAIRAQLEKP